jgi:muconolactone delta-isomerase
MRFLIVTKSKSPLPLEMAMPMLQAMKGWLSQNSAKTRESWGFAGTQGGGGIIEVDSLEELDAIMQAFPLAPFSETEIYPLVDVQESLDRSIQAIQAMLPPSH